MIGTAEVFYHRERLQRARRRTKKKPRLECLCAKNRSGFPGTDPCSATGLWKIVLARCRIAPPEETGGRKVPVPVFQSAG